HRTTIVQPDHMRRPRPDQIADHRVIVSAAVALRTRRANSSGSVSLSADQFGPQCKPSSSMNGSCNAVAMRTASVVLPEPEVPITTMRIAGLAAWPNQKLSQAAMQSAAWTAAARAGRPDRFGLAYARAACRHGE